MGRRRCCLALPTSQNPSSTTSVNRAKNRKGRSCYTPTPSVVMIVLSAGMLTATTLSTNAVRQKRDLGAGETAGTPRNSQRRARWWLRRGSREGEDQEPQGFKLMGKHEKGKSKC